MTKTGAGTLKLNAAAGSWTNSNLVVNNGTVQLGANDALGAGGATLTNVTLNSTTAGTTALLDLNDFNQTVLSLTFSGTGTTATSTNNVSTGASTLRSAAMSPSPLPTIRWAPRFPARSISAPPRAPSASVIPPTRFLT